MGVTAAEGSFEWLRREQHSGDWSVACGDWRLELGKVAVIRADEDV